MSSQREISERLRQETTACRVHFTWLGTRKSFTSDQKKDAADQFGADRNFVSASKKLFDTKHPLYQALTSLKGDIIGYWKGCTLPYVEDGVRLLDRMKIEPFNAAMDEFKTRFNTAVEALDERMGELIREAKDRLGDLFDRTDYPSSVLDQFRVWWDFPSIEPPEHLRQISPAVYEQERARVQARLEEAVALAERAFTEEFAGLVESLRERLTPDPDGKPKVFKESTVQNLHDFINRFRSLSLGSNDQLEALVAQAQELVNGIDGKQIRESKYLRNEIAQGMSGIVQALEPLIVKAPRRRIITPDREANANREAVPA